MLIPLFSLTDTPSWLPRPYLASIMSRARVFDPERCSPAPSSAGQVAHHSERKPPQPNITDPLSRGARARRNLPVAIPLTPCPAPSVFTTRPLPEAAHPAYIRYARAVPSPSLRRVLPLRAFRSNPLGQCGPSRGVPRNNLQGSAAKPEILGTTSCSSDLVSSGDAGLSTLRSTRLLVAPSAELVPAGRRRYPHREGRETRSGLHKLEPSGDNPLPG